METRMDYKYSYIVDPSTYETHGLCDGIPLRCHFNPEYEEIETLRCQEDWRKWVGPLGFYKGGLGPKWNFMAITVPECLPERLGILGYANELAFLHDDITDVVAVGDEHNDDLRLAFEQGAENGLIANATTGKRAIQAHIAQAMMAIHKEQAMVTMRAWAEFAELGSGRHHDTRFKTEAEYIKYRMVDIGTMFWYGMVTFGMGISIPLNEINLAHELANVAYLNLGLTNDLYSYQKEYDTAMAMGQDYVVNVIWVLMEEHGISEDDAKDVCRVKIKQTIVDFRQIVADTNARDDVSSETKRYLEGLLYSLSGNLVWSIDCPRYHTWSSYNERQLDWMKNGIPCDVNYGLGQQAQASGSIKRKEPHQDHVFAANGKEERSAFGHGLAGEGMVQTGLVNVFAGQDIRSLRTIKILDSDDAVQRTSFNMNGGVPSPPSSQSSSPKRKTSPHLDMTIIEAPYEYLSSMPSKGVRETLINALNIWYKIPEDKLVTIKTITSLLHNASLMLDDLEDGSDLRRGRPSTHTIFGAGQTVNAANYHILRAFEEVQNLGDQESLKTFIDELKNLFVGQSLDLYWTRNMVVPSVEQYFQMVENKTGGLFRLIGRLMQLQSTDQDHSKQDLQGEVNNLLNAFGRYFQIRDDYQNLVSSDYTKQKGFCEDLDEGKYSLPLIHLLSSTPNNHVLRNLLTQRLLSEGSTQAHKETILTMMGDSGSLAYTSDVLSALHATVVKGVADLEGKFGVENAMMRHTLAKLDVKK